MPRKTNTHPTTVSKRNREPEVDSEADGSDDERIQRVRSPVKKSKQTANNKDTKSISPSNRKQIGKKRSVDEAEVDESSSDFETPPPAAKRPNLNKPKPVSTTRSVPKATKKSKTVPAKGVTNAGKPSRSTASAKKTVNSRKRATASSSGKKKTARKAVSTSAVKRPSREDTADDGGREQQEEELQDDGTIEGEDYEKVESGTEGMEGAPSIDISFGDDDMSDADSEGHISDTDIQDVRLTVEELAQEKHKAESRICKSAKRITKANKKKAKEEAYARAPAWRKADILLSEGASRRARYDGLVKKQLPNTHSLSNAIPSLKASGQAQLDKALVLISTLSPEDAQKLWEVNGRNRGVTKFEDLLSKKDEATQNMERQIRDQVATEIMHPVASVNEPALPTSSSTELETSDAKLGSYNDLAPSVSAQQGDPRPEVSEPLLAESTPIQSIPTTDSKLEVIPEEGLAGTEDADQGSPPVVQNQASDLSPIAPNEVVGIQDLTAVVEGEAPTLNVTS